MVPVFIWRFGPIHSSLAHIQASVSPNDISAKKIVKSVDRTDIRCSFFTLMLMQDKNWASLERSLLPVEIGQPGQQQSIWLSWTIREKALVMRSTHSRSVGGCRARVTRQAATCVLKARAFYDRILSGLNTINLASLLKAWHNQNHLESDQNIEPQVNLDLMLATGKSKQVRVIEPRSGWCPPSDAR